MIGCELCVSWEVGHIMCLSSCPARYKSEKKQPNDTSWSESCRHCMHWVASTIAQCFEESASHRANILDDRRMQRTDVYQSSGLRRSCLPKLWATPLERQALIFIFFLWNAFPRSGFVSHPPLAHPSFSYTRTSQS